MDDNVEQLYFIPTRHTRHNHFAEFLVCFKVRVSCEITNNIFNYTEQLVENMIVGQL